MNVSKKYTNGYRLILHIGKAVFVLLSKACIATASQPVAPVLLPHLALSTFLLWFPVSHFTEDTLGTLRLRALY